MRIYCAHGRYSNNGSNPSPVIRPARSSRSAHNGYLPALVDTFQPASKIGAEDSRAIAIRHKSN